MIVYINSKGWGDSPKTHDNSYYEFLNGFGLDFINHYNFKVIDEKLFFLSVIKYGISYEEVKNDSKLHFVWSINKDLAIRRKTK
jgi:hypothetical protein